MMTKAYQVYIERISYCCYPENGRYWKGPLFNGPFQYLFYTLFQSVFVYQFFVCFLSFLHFLAYSCSFFFLVATKFFLLTPGFLLLCPHPFLNLRFTTVLLVYYFFIVGHPHVCIRFNVKNKHDQQDSNTNHDYRNNNLCGSPTFCLCLLRNI